MDFSKFTHDIETPRLLLRRMKPEDGLVFHQLFDHDPLVYEFDPGKPCTAEERSLWTVRHALEPDMAAGRCGLHGRAVVRRSDGRVVGAAGMLAITMPGGLFPDTEGPGATLEASLFFQLGLEHWGKGYMQEACTSLVDFSLRVLGLPRVICGTHRLNYRALALMERLGFSHDITLPPEYWGEDIVCGVLWRK